MTGYFVRTLLVLVRRSPVLYALTVAGVALGVASVITIQLINDNAIAAFAASVHAVSGDAELTIVSRVGGLDETVIVDVIADEATHAAWPTLRIDAIAAEHPIDILASDLTRLDRFPLADGMARFGDPLSTNGWIALSPKLAGALGLRPGDRFEVVSGARRVHLTLGAIVDFQRGAPLASASLAIMDIAQAQSLFAAHRVLDEIGVDLIDNADRAAAAQRFRAQLGSTVDVLTPDERSEQAAGLLNAFRLNLTALSLISLAVGVFLIHSSLQATLVRRRLEFGVLRALGATRTQVMGLVLGEVAAIGVLGTAVGLPLGYWAARANIDVVSGTLTSLYLLQAVEEVRVPGWLVVLGVGIGMGSAFLGATLSLLELRREDTRSLLVSSTLQESLVKLAPRLAVVVLVLWGVVGATFTLVVRGWAPTGFVVAVVILASVALLTPWLVLRIAGLAKPRAFGFVYSLRTIGQKLASNAFAVASLAIAVSMMFGITLMVGSFRATLETWVGTSVQADIYVSTLTHARRSRSATLDDAVLAVLRATPELIAIDTLRRAEARVGARIVRVNGVDMRVPGADRRYPLMHDAAGVFDDVLRGNALVTEPLARKAGFTRGAVMKLLTATGEHDVRVAGVFYDYATEQGAVFVDHTTFERLVGSRLPASAALYLREGTDVEAVVDRLSRQLRDVPLNIRSNQRLRNTIYTIFDQTFAITGILQAMSLLIAVCGITLTLLVLARERAAELALYRALGATRRQVFGLFVGHGVALASFGVVFGAVGGGALALVLVFLINRAYFGWTIQLALPGAALLQQICTLLAAAVIAALYPAARAARTPATELVRDDL